MVDGGESFIDFVDTVLSVSGSFPMRNISITCRNSIDANTGPVTRWMTDAVRHNVVNLDIDVTAAGDVSLVPLEIFTCKTLVHLKLAKGFEAMIPEDVSLPSLKSQDSLSISAGFIFTTAVTVFWESFFLHALSLRN